MSDVLLARARRTDEEQTAAAARFAAIVRAFRRAVPVDEVRGPLTRRAFMASCVAAGRPVLLRGQAAGWPASARWSFHSLAREGAGLSVPVTLGNAELHGSRVVHVDLRDYLGAVEAGRGAEAGYLSLYDLLADLPHLKRDVRFEELYRRTTARVYFGWIGPSGSVTGLHADHYENLLAQIVGRKALLLFPPGERARLYPTDKYDFATTLSQLDPEHPDLFPDALEAEALVAVLDPGDVLYIPRLFWHYVLSLDASISVSCFGVGPWQFIRYGLLDLFTEAAHRLRPARRSPCVCHPKGPA